MGNTVIGIRLSNEKWYESAEIRVDDEGIVGILFDHIDTDGEECLTEFKLTKDQFKCICEFIRDKP